MVYVVKRDWDPVGHLVSEYWSDRYSRAHMGNTKKAEEIANASARAAKATLCIGIAAILSKRRIDKYEYVGDMIPMVEYWDVQKILEKYDKEWPFSREERDSVLQSAYEEIIDLIEDEHLEKRNTEIRREKVVTGEIEANDEDKAYFAEQARQLQEQAQRFSQLGSGHTVEYLVKGGRTEIEI
jgi:hypothetical protein